MTTTCITCQMWLATNTRSQQQVMFAEYEDAFQWALRWEDEYLTECFTNWDLDPRDSKRHITLELVDILGDDDLPF